MGNRIEQIDILNREDFINRTIQLVKIISANRGNTTFAITGEWGCGKTFVMDEIQNRLGKDAETDFLVIPYNCWRYDYYNEPLVAIVSALLDFADTTAIIPEEMKFSFKQIILKFGVGLATQVIKDKTGIDLKETTDQIKATIEGYKQDVEKAHDFDDFFTFKKALAELKEKLEELSVDYTLVFAVDELDRCLPEYAIKVLERLHHISEGIPNMITIIAVDKQRLANTVNSIFGNKDDEQDDCANKYLKKFIRFELQLDNGKQDSPKFFNKFPDYYSRFDASLYHPLENTEQFLLELFQDVDIRSQERIVEKASILHDICFGEEKQDHSVMYMELFYATLFYYYKNEHIFDTIKQVYSLDDVFSDAGTVPKAFRLKQSGFQCRDSRINRDILHTILIVNNHDIFATILLYWYYAPEPDKNRVEGRDALVPHYSLKGSMSDQIANNINKMRKYIDLLKTIA